MCVYVPDIRGLELCHPLMSLPVTLASTQGRKHVIPACHTQIVEHFLYGWLEYQRMCQSWITQAQLVILVIFNLSLHLPKACNNFGKYGGEATRQTRHKLQEQPRFFPAQKKLQKYRNKWWHQTLWKQEQLFHYHHPVYGERRGGTVASFRAHVCSSAERN